MRPVAFVVVCDRPLLLVGLDLMMNDDLIAPTRSPTTRLAEPSLLATAEHHVIRSLRRFSQRKSVSYTQPKRLLCTALRTTQCDYCQTSRYTFPQVTYRLVGQAPVHPLPIWFLTIWSTPQQGQHVFPNHVVPLLCNPGNVPATFCDRHRQEIAIADVLSPV
jgi:hypothetical protein